MSPRRFTVADIRTPINRAEVAAQLKAVAHPRTIHIEPAGELAPARPLKIKRREIDATAFFVAAGLPAPTREHVFLESRKFRFDYAWIDAHVALEVEGGVWTGGRHTRGAGFMRDVEKYNLAAVHGWMVARCTPSTLRTAATVAILMKLLRR